MDGGLDNQIRETPTDDEFKVHFENLLNPLGNENCDTTDVSDCPYIPIRDDAITENELKEATSTCKENKSFIGISPAIFKCLPWSWITFLVQLLNIIFFDNQLTYPFKWCFNKLVVIFMKGGRMNCGNYRGLSIGDTLVKLYGKILCNRLKLWMDIDRCQAGAQEKRGCAEHILA